MKAYKKKILKLVTLLMTSLMIGYASAATYKYLYIDGSVSFTTGTGLRWVEGSDAPASTSISGTTVTIPFQVQNGTPTNFTYCLYLENLDASSHSILINVTNDATSSYYDEFNIFIFDNDTDTYIATLNVLDGTSSYDGTISGSAIWRLTFEITAKSTTTSGSDEFDLQFRYE